MPVSDEFLAHVQRFASQHANQQVNEHSSADPTPYLRHLAEDGWTCLDWPVPWNPTPLTHEAQLAFVRTLAECRCPGPPTALTVIAGVLLAVGTPAQQARFLPELASQPWHWKLVRETAWVELQSTPDGFVMAQVPEEDGSTLYIVSATGSEQIGEQGQAARYLSGCVSIPWTLQVLLTTTAMLAPLTDSSERHELEIDLLALEQRYLTGASADAIRLSLTDCCSRAYFMLFDSLGYYALLNPDPVLHGNEPLPFEAERAQLERLRTLTLPDEMIQKDLLHGEND